MSKAEAEARMGGQKAAEGRQRRARARIGGILPQTRAQRGRNGKEVPERGAAVPAPPTGGTQSSGGAVTAQGARPERDGTGEQQRGRGLRGGGPGPAGRGGDTARGPWTGPGKASAASRGKRVRSRWAGTGHETPPPAAVLNQVGPGG